MLIQNLCKCVCIQDNLNQTKYAYGRLPHEKLNKVKRYSQWKISEGKEIMKTKAE